MRQRNAKRRMIEEARELKKADDPLYEEKR
jgi:hypothetical protein